MTRTYTTKERPSKAISFTLDDRDITFTMPKRASLVMGISGLSNGSLDQTRAFLDWFSEGLSDDDAQWILDRLQDPADPFDLDTLEPIIVDLIGDAAGRPTKRSPASSRPQKTVGSSTDGQQPTA